jgi:hypothetical protein
MYVAKVVFKAKERRQPINSVLFIGLYHKRLTNHFKGTL